MLWERRLCLSPRKRTGLVCGIRACAYLYVLLHSGGVRASCEIKKQSASDFELNSQKSVSSSFNRYSLYADGCTLAMLTTVAAGKSDYYNSMTADTDSCNIIVTVPDTPQQVYTFNQEYKMWGINDRVAVCTFSPSKCCPPKFISERYISHKNEPDLAQSRIADWQGTYQMPQLFLKGNVKAFVYSFYGSADGPRTFELWRTSDIESFRGMFSNSRIPIRGIDQWTTTASTNFQEMFHAWGNPNRLDQSVDISNWDMDAAVYLNYMFAMADVSRVIPVFTRCCSSAENMAGMFMETTFNGKIGHWDTTKVKSLSRMFQSAKEFDQPVGKWSTSSCTDMSHMYSGALEFNRDINAWDVSAVGSFSAFLSGASRFNTGISSWTPSSATNMDYMFRYAVSFNQPVDWIGKTESNCVSAIRMFDSAVNFNRDCVHLNKVHRAEYMFHNAVAFDGSVQTERSTMCQTDDTRTMEGMFSEAASFTGKGIDRWPVAMWEGVRVLSYMFYNAINFDSVLSQACLDTATHTASMFDGAVLFKGQQLLQNCQAAPSNLCVIDRMFRHAAVFNADISSWTMGKSCGTHSANGAFAHAVQFNSDIALRIGNWDWAVPGEVEVESMFESATAFNANTDLLFGDSIGMLKMERMFYGASAFTARSANGLQPDILIRLLRAQQQGQQDRDLSVVTCRDAFAGSGVACDILARALTVCPAISTTCTDKTVTNSPLLESDEATVIHPEAAVVLGVFMIAVTVLVLISVRTEKSVN